MHLVSHFHYDPVWWNTQAAYTVAWDELDFAGSHRGARQLAGFDLVRAHLDLALAEPDYRFVLAEVDYLKPYWDTYPQDRAVLRRLHGEGRVEVMGGTYNEPNTNLTDPETTIRNFVHGMRFPARRARRATRDRLAARRVRARPGLPRVRRRRRAHLQSRGRAGRSTSGARWRRPARARAIRPGCSSPASSSGSRRRGAGCSPPT